MNRDLGIEVWSKKLFGNCRVAGDYPAEDSLRERLTDLVKGFANLAKDLHSNLQGFWLRFRRFTAHNNFYSGLLSILIELWSDGSFCTSSNELWPWTQGLPSLQADQDLWSVPGSWLWELPFLLYGPGSRPSSGLHNIKLLRDNFMYGSN